MTKMKNLSKKLLTLGLPICMMAASLAPVTAFADTTEYGAYVYLDDEASFSRSYDLGEEEPYDDDHYNASFINNLEYGESFTMGVKVKDTSSVKAYSWSYKSFVPNSTDADGGEMDFNDNKDGDDGYYVVENQNKDILTLKRDFIRNRRYRCIVTYNSGENVPYYFYISGKGTLYTYRYVNGEFEASGEYLSAEVARKEGRDYTLGIDAESKLSGAKITYQWYSVDGENETKIDGATSSTYRVTTSNPYNEFYCVVSDGTSTIYTPLTTFTLITDEDTWADDPADNPDATSFDRTWFSTNQELWMVYNATIDMALSEGTAADKAVGTPASSNPVIADDTTKPSTEPSTEDNTKPSTEQGTSSNTGSTTNTGSSTGSTNSGNTGNSTQSTQKSTTTTQPATSTTKESSSTTTTTDVAVGTKFTSKSITYKVTAKNTVSVTKIGKKVKKASIPATISYKGTKFNVTAIDKNAAKSNKVLKSVTIPSKVTKIGASAFNGCKNLKTITIKTSKLGKKSIGKSAFKGINKKATIKVPKKSKKNYAKYLKTAGIAKTVKVK